MLFESFSNVNLDNQHLGHPASSAWLMAGL